MKTNQVMIPSELRKQRTKDGYLNATFLIESWNKSNPCEEKQLAKFKILSSTKEFIEQLKKEGIEKPFISGRGSGKNAGTWMHPKLFVDLAMWISLEFKSMALGWIVDGLIKSRHDAGDYYNEMCAAILNRHVDYYKSKPNPNVYINEARMIKQLAGVAEKERNELSEKELTKITLLQKQNANFITKGFGKDKRIKLMELFAESI